MALGTIARVPTTATSLDNPAALFAEVLSFPGDAAYPTGGTTAFQASVRAKLANYIEIIAVVGQDCGGYIPVYNKADDKLKVFLGNGAAVLTEAGSQANLSSVTFNVLVIGK